MGSFVPGGGASVREVACLRRGDMKSIALSIGVLSSTVIVNFVWFFRILLSFLMYLRKSRDQLGLAEPVF